MEISESTIGIFYVSKLFGLSPYSVKKRGKGRSEIQRSIFFTVYSILLIVTMASLLANFLIHWSALIRIKKPEVLRLDYSRVADVSLTYKGLLFDANSKIPIRMKSATSKVVTALDVSVVVLATVAGVICGLIGVRSTNDVNRRLYEIDEALSTYTNETKDRWRGYSMLIISMTTISVMLGLDILTWSTKAEKMKNEQHEETDVGKIRYIYMKFFITFHIYELNVQWYIPFYSLYFILVSLHVRFAHSGFGLARRYRRLNMALKNHFLEGQQNSDYNSPFKGRVKIVRVSSIKAISKPSKAKVFELNSANKTVYGNLTKDTSVINGCRNIALIDRLAYIHESLGKCVQSVSSAYGSALVFMLVSCLLHLVATSYFLFLELMEQEPKFSYLQWLWILLHIMRLLLIVEPCHLTTEEANKTIYIICEIERTQYDLVLTDGLRKFWQQLLIDQAKFSACGLCTIDRQILTSYSGAICTYLVILIQFQSTSG